MHLEAVAYHLEQRIDLSVIRSKTSHLLIKREQSYLFYKIDDYSFLYFKDYGSVVFINCDMDFIKTTFKQVIKDPLHAETLPSENFMIEIKKDGNINIDFDKIQLPELDADFAHIIMLNMGQSVALDNYYNKTNELLENTRKYALQLETQGSIRLSQKQMKKFIGRTINIKNRIAENLFIFDAPSLAWSKEELSNLDTQMKEELDMTDRYHGLQLNLTIVNENLALFKDILHHKYSSALEWIIILLILFEILQVITEKLMQ